MLGNYPEQKNIETNKHNKRSTALLETFNNFKNIQKEAMENQKMHKIRERR